jgi:multiple sugar transport system substrate-binding protein
MRSRRFMPAAALGLASVMMASTGGIGAAQSGGWEAFEDGLRDKYAGRTLRIITINDPFVPAMQETNRLFTELTGAEVVVDGYGYDAVYEREQLACQQQSSSYDVIVFDVPWTQAFDGCTEYLNDRIEAADPEVVAYDDYFEVMREAVDWDGNVIGLPFAPYFVLQHYNTEYFDILGLSPATNFDEWVANAEAANRSPELPDVYGTITNNQAGSAVGQAFFEFIYNFEGGKPFESMYPGTEDAYADMTPLFSSPQGIAVIELFKRILPHQPEGALNFAWTERQNYFNTGLIAFNNQWNVTTPSADDPETSTIVGNVGTAPFPHDSEELVTQVGGWSMAINAFAEDPEFSWDYLQWFTSPQINVEFAKLGGFPSRESTLANAELNEQYPWYETLKEVIPTAFADCRPRNNESFNIINTLGTYISRAMSGEMTTEEAMRAADRDIGTMLQEAGYTVNLPEE